MNSKSVSSRLKRAKVQNLIRRGEGHRMWLSLKILLMRKNMFIILIRNKKPRNEDKRRREAPLRKIQCILKSFHQTGLNLWLGIRTRYQQFHRALQREILTTETRFQLDTWPPDWQDRQNLESSSLKNSKITGRRSFWVRTLSTEPIDQNQRRNWLAQMLESQ